MEKINRNWIPWNAVAYLQLKSRNLTFNTYKNETLLLPQSYKKDAAG